MNTDLEAVAVKILYPEACTICSIFIPPDVNPHPDSIDKLIKSLPAPYILTGDFNAYNALWNSPSSSYTNHRGRIIEAILDNITLLNNGSPTHFSAQYGTFSTIDLTLCDPKIAPNLQWYTLPSLNGSDHFPIIINNLLKTQTPSQIINTKWDLENVNWQPFVLELENVNLFLPEESDINIKINNFNTKICEAGEKFIGVRKTVRKKKIVPWWNEDCQYAAKKNNLALSKYKRHNTIENLIELKRTKARRVIKESKRLSWQRYVSSINPDTTPKEIWGKINRIKGKNAIRNTTTILKDGKIINKPQDIVNTLAETFEYLSSNNHYTQTFSQYKEAAEKNEIYIREETNTHLTNPLHCGNLSQLLTV